MATVYEQERRFQSVRLDDPPGFGWQLISPMDSPLDPVKEKKKK